MFNPIFKENAQGRKQQVVYLQNQRYLVTESLKYWNSTAFGHKMADRTRD